MFFLLLGQSLFLLSQKFSVYTAMKAQRCMECLSPSHKRSVTQECSTVSESSQVNKNNWEYLVINDDIHQTRRAITRRCWAGAVVWVWRGRGVYKVPSSLESLSGTDTTFQVCLTVSFSTLGSITAPSPRVSAARSSATRSTGVTAARRMVPAPWSRPWPAWPSPSWRS